MTLKQTLLLFICILPLVAYGDSDSDIRYYKQLEAIYGQGMMTPGNNGSIDLMLDVSLDISFKGISALEYGSGTGGVAFYMANLYGMNITGIDASTWKVSTAQKRTPDKLLGQVNFALNEDPNKLPFQDQSFDLIYSKEMLAYLETKDGLLQEFNRILNNQGYLFITDIISLSNDSWDTNAADYMKYLNINLYPKSEQSYIDFLKQYGFEILEVRDDSCVYMKYNQDTLDILQDPEQQKYLSEYYTDEELKMAIQGYQSLLAALVTKELQILQFIAQKKK